MGPVWNHRPHGLDVHLRAGRAPQDDPDLREKWWCHQPFDLVIFDIRILSLLATELVERLKSRKPHVMIILLGVCPGAES